MHQSFHQFLELLGFIAQTQNCQKDSGKNRFLKTKTFYDGLIYFSPKKLSSFLLSVIVNDHITCVNTIKLSFLDKGHSIFYSKKHMNMKYKNAFL